MQSEYKHSTYNLLVINLTLIYCTQNTRKYLVQGEILYNSFAGDYDEPHKFTGKRLDEESGLYDFGARPQDPKLGIFISTDKKWYLSPHQSSYAFCSNDPVNRIDPDGNWDIDVHAYSNRGKSGYAVFIVKDRNGGEIYRTIVKAVGAGGRTRNVKNADTPQGSYKILGYRKTGNAQYPRDAYGPNDLLALEYQGGEGGSRDGIHVHGGRQEGKGEVTDLGTTYGCLRINDQDIADMKKITDALEASDPLESKGALTVTDDLTSPVKYNNDRHDAGTDQFPKTSATDNSDNSSGRDFGAPCFVVPTNTNNNRVTIPYKLPADE